MDGLKYECYLLGPSQHLVPRERRSNHDPATVTNHVARKPIHVHVHRTV